jgi:hypothetical protein
MTQRPRAEIKGEPSRGAHLMSFFIKLAVTATLMWGMGGIPTGAQEITRKFSPECAERELGALIAIEDAGMEGTGRYPELIRASSTLIQARRSCYAGRQSEGLAYYDEIIGSLRHDTGVISSR